jgi:succinoglycan biosynthesis protein ExoM
MPTLQQNPPVTAALKHLSVCICTYKRPELLRRLLDKLRDQETGGQFTYSIVVVDNDAAESAKTTVQDVASSSRILIRYCMQPQQNISLTRNMAVANADGDFLVFIDDDEFPIPQWLFFLFKTCNEYNVDGVLGPVRRHFDEQPPDWIIKGDFYERPIEPTGSAVPWQDGRTGNVILKKELFANQPEPFKPEFRGGEDTDFFRRMIDLGHKFIWSAEAIAYETVPPSRWNRKFMLKRALLRGAVTLTNPNFGTREILKSLVAVPAYALMLPFALLFGQHRFMVVLVKLCDHLGKLLALVGIDPIKGPYVTG